MLPLFLYPLAFLGLLAVPALVAIYLFRNRFRRQPVSSLMLWVDARESREGGPRLRQLQLPILFLLELLVILLLVVSAAAPFFRVHQSTRPLVVVLDDSFSMLAGGDESPRELAAAALREQLAADPPYSVQFVLAGQRPQVLGEAARTPAEAMGQLSGWRCRSAEADLGAALVLAAQHGRGEALLLVLTDRAPDKGAALEKGRLKWWAFGQPRGNVAFVNASRTARDGADRCLLEAANLSDAPARRRCVVEPEGGGAPLGEYSLDLAPSQTRRLVLTLPAATGAIRARLGPDELPFDDTVVLQPAASRPVRVAVKLADNDLRERVERAVKGTRQALVVPGGGPRVLDLLLTDGPGKPTAPEGCWVVQFKNGAETKAYDGPFVLDRNHPLTDGLSLQGVIWGACPAADMPGAPVVTAGNVALVTEARSASPSGAVRRHLHVNFRLDRSALAGKPAWPSLFVNLIEWRSSELPGPAQTNLRLGETACVNLPAYRDTALLTPPGEAAREVLVKGAVVSWPVDAPGTWALRAGEDEWKVSASALAADESDLRRAESGQWGDWLDETTLRLEYAGASWLLLLLLLGLACLHLLLLRVTPRDGRAAS